MYDIFKVNNSTTLTVVANFHMHQTNVESLVVSTNTFNVFSLSLFSIFHLRTMLITICVPSPLVKHVTDVMKYSVLEYEGQRTPDDHRISLFACDLPYCLVPSPYTSNSVIFELKPFQNCENVPSILWMKLTWNHL